MPQEESVLRLGRDEALEAARLWQECGDAREFACRVLGGVMNALMDSEAQQMCGAGRNERSDGRENSRNGYRPRSLKTAVGDVELEIPKLGHGTYYPEGMLARWSRVDTSVAALVQEMYVCGVSTRKVERVASRLGISSLSSSEVSSLCSDLDAEVAEFRRRDLSATPCCYLWLDATYMSCRVGSSVVSQGVVTAIGLGADGRKHFLGCDAVDTESEDSWAAFLGGLRERGLAGVRLVVSDSHAGLVAAVSRLFQGCAWQRCVTHLQRNLQSACSGRPEDSKAAVRDLVHAAVYQDDPDLARCVWAEAAPWVASVSARAGEVPGEARPVGRRPLHRDAGRLPGRRDRPGERLVSRRVGGEPAGQDPAAPPVEDAQPVRVGVGVDPAEDRPAGAGCRFGSHVSLRSFRARLDRADGTLTGRDRMRLIGSAVSLRAPIRSCGGLGSPRPARDMSGNEGSPVGASGMWGHRAVRI